MSSQPPHSIEAEQCLLGAILVNGESFDRVENILDADDFFEPIHRYIYGQFEKAKQEGRRISYPLLNASLSDQVKGAKIAGLTVSQYLARLAAEATTIINAPDHARIIKEHSDRRRLMDLGQGMILAAQAGAEAPRALAADCLESCDEIVAHYQSQHVMPVTAGRAAERSIARMKLALMNQGKITGVTTGVPALDEALNGWQRGELIILAGRPGMGKSAVIASSIRQSAERGANVHLFSLEMSAEEIADRMLADALYRSRDSIKYFDISRGRLTEQEAEAIIDAQQALKDLPIKIETEGGLTISQIATRARRHQQALERQGRTLDVLVVDHLHIVRPSNRYKGNRVAEVTETSAALKVLAKELNVPVIVAAQLNRQVEGRDDKRPTLADLRDSGAIEQDADAILFLYREEYYLQARLGDAERDNKRVARLRQVRRKLEINIAKHRAGPTGVVDLFLDVPSNALRSEAPYDLAGDAI